MKYKVHALNIRGVAKNPFLPLFEDEFHNPVVKHILKSIQYNETLTFRKLNTCLSVKFTDCPVSVLDSPI